MCLSIYRLCEGPPKAIDEVLDLCILPRMSGAQIHPGLSKKRASERRGALAILDQVREFKRISELKGGLVPQAVAGTVLGVSRQRIHQLISEGTFSVWQFYGMNWLSQDEVVSFAKLERAAGENQHKPSVKELWKVSRETGKEFGRRVER